MREKHWLVFGLLVVSPAFASNPGEPFDCADWSLGPGITCAIAKPFPCLLTTDPPGNGNGGSTRNGDGTPHPICVPDVNDLADTGLDKLVDAEGNVYALDDVGGDSGGMACDDPAGGGPNWNLHLVRFDGAGDAVVASLARERCLGFFEPTQRDRVVSASAFIDPEHGRIFVATRMTSGIGDGFDGHQLFELSGFPAAPAPKGPPFGVGMGRGPVPR